MENKIPRKENPKKTVGVLVMENSSQRIPTPTPTKLDNPRGPIPTLLPSDLFVPNLVPPLLHRCRQLHRDLQQPSRHPQLRLKDSFSQAFPSFSLL